MSKHFDLIVIGAGVLGTFHAYHASKLGKRVLLLEKDQHPSGATVRNFGQAVPSGLASGWFEYGKRSTEIYKEIQAGFDISVRNNGSVYIASDEDEQALLHELKSVMDMRGYEAQLLSARQCLTQWPALKNGYCREALFFPQEISLEPETMIYRLLQFCKSRFPNLSYLPSTSVTDCRVEGSLVRVVTSDLLQFTAEKVILCNGSEFKLLFADLFRESGIVITKLQMLRTIPQPEVKLEGNILTGLTIRRYESFAECPSYSSLKTQPHLAELKKWGIHVLFKKALDGSVIIGDSHEYANVLQSDSLGFTVNQHINELMLSEAERIVSFNVKKIATFWTGFYSQHLEKNLVEHDIGNRIHIRTAIGGKGMSSAAGYAERSIQRLFELD